MLLGPILTLAVLAIPSPPSSRLEAAPAGPQARGEPRPPADTRSHADTPSDPPASPREAAAAPTDEVTAMLVDELAYSMRNLKSPEGTRPYFIAYTVYDERRVDASATLGAIVNAQDDRSRNLNVEVRVGDYALDNTHVLRERGGVSRYGGSGNTALSLDLDRESMRHALWLATDTEFKDAIERLQKVETNLKVKVEEEDRSEDFTREPPSVAADPPARIEIDLAEWKQRVRRVSAAAREFPLIYSSSVGVSVHVSTRTIVSSEGTRLRTAETRCRVMVQASTKADDGMDLAQFEDFNAFSPEGLPTEAEVEAALRRVIAQVLALREAPLVEPYTGPAILLNRASGVFFHEIFGHRIEGHRQKDVSEGQTFTKKINQPVLPEFISVFDDPTIARAAGVDLRGHYAFDDEGVPAQRAALVDDGVLKTFVMSRSPVAGFTQSNGHGRRQPGEAPVSRQGNLVVLSDKVVPFERLRELLLEECRRQDKPYGLLFEDISGGFTTTTRRGPQSFKVLPVVVYRVYPDGRPDELVRGVDIVGTPLSCFERILCTGDDPGVFNGSCGAESGWVPVSAVSPSILVGTIEVEKRERDQSRPPILPSPLATGASPPTPSSGASSTPTDGAQTP
jgi:predicted Zn-dependent protease